MSERFECLANNNTDNQNAEQYSSIILLSCWRFLRHSEPKCFHALSGPVLRDTARLSQRYLSDTRYGVFGVSTWPIGCDTPSPFSERFPLGEHAK